MDRPVAFLIDSARSDMVFEKEFMDLNRAKRISLKNPIEAIKALRAMIDGVLDGHVHCVFPEGGYSDNHNNLQDFRSGCLHYIKAMKCSVVPVCLYDSWKVLGTSIRGPIKAQIHFLKQIEPKEIESLTKAELTK